MGLLSMPAYTTKPAKTKDMFAYVDSNERETILYGARNLVNGNQYIGITRLTLDERRRKHLTSANQGVRGRFYNAIRKHGQEKFEFYEIARYPTFKEASQAEREKIAEIDPEYNVTRGGEGALGYRHDAATLEIMRQNKLGKPGPWLGKKRSPETIEKLRAAKLARPQRYWLGKKRDQSTIDKIKAKTKGRPAQKSTPLMEQTRADNMRRASAARRRPVICLTDGEIYESAQDASLAYGFCRTSVAAVCGPNAKCKAVYGLRFAYLAEGEIV